MKILTCIPALFLLQSHAAFAGDMFTALADMEGLVSVEFELVRHLNNYIQAEESRLKNLRGFLEEYKSIYKEASKDVSKYLANPINAYILVKRLTADWKRIEGVMTKNVGPDFVQNITQHRSMLRFPSDTDLNGAATAVIRLQDTYKLDTHSLAEGKLLGKKYSRQLTAGDCWELGRQSYNNNDHYHTVQWMREALKKHKAESKKTVSLQNILEYLEFSTYKLGNVKEALRLANELLTITPNNARILRNKENYEYTIRQEASIQHKGETGDLSRNTKMHETAANTTNLKLTVKPIDLSKEEMYKKLCRGEKQTGTKIEGKLRCRYVTNNVPFYFIQPVKMEEANLKPLIVIYHDVISDDEIQPIKKMAQPRFKSTTKLNNSTGKVQHEPTKYRTAKVGWLKREEHSFVSKVYRRINLITGLDMDTAEDLQVANYGIGGHYEPHVDYVRKGDISFIGNQLERGNRIATWLFYMSDVEAGGATVFPELNVALWPQKGSAAFWYNLTPNGEGNEMTLHAACPVLSGSKWVSNVWIRERNQEFRRPCGVRFDDM